MKVHKQLLQLEHNGVSAREAYKGVDFDKVELDNDLQIVAFRFAAEGDLVPEFFIPTNGIAGAWDFGKGFATSPRFIVKRRCMHCHQEMPNDKL